MDYLRFDAMLKYAFTGVVPDQVCAQPKPAHVAWDSITSRGECLRCGGQLTRMHSFALHQDCTMDTNRINEPDEIDIGWTIPPPPAFSGWTRP